MRILQNESGEFYVKESESAKWYHHNSTAQSKGDLFDEDKELLNRCCQELNDCIHNFDLPNQKEPQDAKIPFNDCVSRGINAINNVRSILEKNGQIIDKLKKKFKKTLIQKHKKTLKTSIQEKYHIDINEMSNDSNKFFRSDEKRWKRIKMFGKHLFSTKATIKGKINKLFNEYVNNDNQDKDYEQQFDNLFDELMRHNNAKKEKKLNKESKLNIAFDNSHKQVI
ncbi:MAG: hypothetical protein IJT14_00355 [Rickettsiales bacterium]|nr:hypothetical protein [Rickettsiales bacterium]